LEADLASGRLVVDHGVRRIDARGAPILPNMGSRLKITAVKQVFLRIDTASVNRGSTLVVAIAAVW
jgi:hypothetical protein